MGNILSRRSCLVNNWFVWDFSWTSFSFLLGWKGGVEVMMWPYDTEDVITRTLVGGAAILCILSILLLVGLLIGLFGLVPFIVIFLGLGVFCFLSYWVGKWFIG